MNAPTEMSPTPPAATRSRWVRTLRTLSRAVFLLFAVFTLLALVGAIENGRGKMALSAWKKEMRAKGEKLSLEELNLPKPVREGNGAPLLLAAGCKLVDLRKTNQLVHRRGLAMRYTSPGKACVVHQQDKPPPPPPPPPPVVRRAPRTPPDEKPAAHDWIELSRQVAEGKVFLKQVDEALKQPTLVVELDYSKGPGILLPIHGSIFREIREIALWLSSAAVNNLHQGDLEGALQNIRRLLSLDRCLEKEPLLISQLVRIAIKSIAFGTTWEALQASGWKEDSLKQLQDLWQKDRGMEDMVFMMETERVMGILGFGELRRSDEFFNQFQDNSKILQKFLTFAAIQFWRYAWTYQDELFYLQSMQSTIESYRQIVTHRAWLPYIPSLQQNEKKRMDLGKWPSVKNKFMFSRGLLPAVQSVHLRFIRSEIQRELTVTAIALKRYHLRHGKFPSHLEALVPGFLPELPVDYIDGKPLRYRLNPDGTFTLYSIGDNGKDDGSDPSPSKTHSPPNLWSGKDAVWPIPASKEEVEQYKAQHLGGIL